MSFILLGSAAAAAFGALGYWLAKRGNDKETQAENAQANVPNQPPPPEPDVDRLAVRLDDVVSAKGQERYLTSGTVVREGAALVCALFEATEPGTAVAAFAPPRREIFWLTRVELSMGSEAPTTLEVQATPLRRVRRLPVKLVHRGGEEPCDATEATLVEYQATTRERVLALRIRGKWEVWFGEALEPGEFDRLGTGGPSDEEAAGTNL